ncbi:MAG: hypothetical protein H6684_04075 [Deltaproteobacteria bacterium]|nr:hypothetical protein [bacterium]MCB9477404.1 hypothetical protein [Deltaproteobacteria bacterium]MCB9480143.1 hypothetical protein [Deltaproteobacteria bacterium]MCB9487891.1 hypothetical protein [Deltaproteobacteria bacterium]
MRVPRSAIVSLFLLTLSTFLAMACGDDTTDTTRTSSTSTGDDDDDFTGTTDDDVSDDPACVDNGAPRIEEVRGVVNGSVRSLPFTASESDDIEFEVDFNDVGCNVSGESIQWRTSEGTLINGFAIISGDLPCVDNVSEGTFLAAPSTTALIDGSSGASDSAIAKMQLVDSCGAGSNSYAVEYELD